MKSYRKYVALSLALMTIINVLVFCTIQAFAHDAILNVDYDNCASDPNDDDINKMWYVLDEDSKCFHVDHEMSTVKYYFADSAPGSTYTWTTDVSAAVAQEIKNAYAESMKKWNDVYFYSYDDDNILTKHKVVNIVEGTESDYNVIIYPITGSNNFAQTIFSYTTENLVESGAINHYHISEFVMEVNVDSFYVHGSYSQAVIDVVRERTGAHEFGHVLGLCDIDANNLCNASNQSQHHHELLMGYGSPATNRAVDITYKDIAGVAITRGLHTDSDHKWLNCGLQSDGKYKLICSICNGVKYVNSLSGYTYEAYGACGDSHTLSGGNMMAVASYGTKDYYKCEYCRYVAPFDSIVSQSYSKTNYNSSLHKCINNVDGLEYTFYEEHSPYVYMNKYNHRRSCLCGLGVQIAPHAILASDIVSGSNYAPCMGCGYLLDLRDNDYNTIASITQMSINGSYILPSGIVVLIDEDVQAYLDGTLVFYYTDDLPEKQ